MKRSNLRNQSQLQTSFLVMCVFTLFGCGKAPNQEQKTSAQPDRIAPEPPLKEVIAPISPVIVQIARGDKSITKGKGALSMTYITGKQAFAKLSLHLRENKQPVPKIIWNLSPNTTVLYQGPSGFAGMIGSWDCSYQDEKGNEKQSEISCWGDVEIKKSNVDFSKVYPRAFQIGEWILDDVDANTVVLKAGGRENERNFGGWLITDNIERRGIRCVWSGRWSLPRIRSVFVDAQTGEMYRAKGGGMDKFEPIAPSSGSPSREWNGSFDETGADKQSGDWWPLGYRDLEGRLIHNRKLLNEKLTQERAKVSRSASSWMTTGVGAYVLGNYQEALDDLTRAVQMATGNHDYRYYRGLVFLVTREIDKASADFRSLPQTYEGRDEAIGYVEIVRGGKDRGGINRFHKIVSTDCGRVPLEVKLGPVELQ